MDGIVHPVLGFLAAFFGIYSLLIFIRIILTWFSGIPSGRLMDFLSRITDPYLNWWRQKFPFRVGHFDFSPLMGIVTLSVAQTVCSMAYRQGKITLGIILAVCLSALWSVISFLLTLSIIILVLRLIAYFTNASIYSPFWQVVDQFSRPLLYRINRIMFGRKLVDYKVGIFSAIAALALLRIGGGIGIQKLTALLVGLPL